MSQRIRRKDRAISTEDALDLLRRGEWGVLSTVGPDGEPYGVPISYAPTDSAVYFHAAQVGRKIDNLAFESRASFCVVGETEPVYENNFSTVYESVIVFGTVRNVTDPAEKTDALRHLAVRYLPDYADKAEDAIRGSFAATRVLALSIDAVTGKARRRKSPAS